MSTIPTLKQVERAIRVPAEKWVARCYEIACKVALGGQVVGHVVGGIRVDSAQISWLANLPYDDLGEATPHLYAALDRVGHRAHVPLDNMRRAEREHPELFKVEKPRRRHSRDAVAKKGTSPAKASEGK